MNSLINFFTANTPPWREALLWGPAGLLWAALGLTAAAACKRRLGWRTGYTRKLFHFFVFGTVALLAWGRGTPAVCLFGGMTSLVVAFAVLRGAGHPWYEALAREKDAPRRTYFVVVPYFATLLGGIAANVIFGRAALAGYLVTGIADAVAEPVGTRFGRHPYRVPAGFGVAATRTWAGSAAVFVASALAALLCLSLAPALPLTATLAARLLLFALACMAIEAVSPHGWDNAALQLAPAAMAVWWLGVLA